MIFVFLNVVWGFLLYYLKSFVCMYLYVIYVQRLVFSQLIKLYVIFLLVRIEVENICVVNY